MRRFLLALQFLTVFRLNRDAAVDPSELGRSMQYFPVVGALLGIMLLVAWYLLSTLLPEGVVTALLLLFLVAASGGLHIDGFADTVDGLAGGTTPEERLRIMKDSAVGALGVVFVVLLLLVKFFAIYEMPLEVKALSLVAFPMAGRWAMVPLALLPYARPSGGLGSSFAGCSRGVVVKATVFTAVAVALLFGALAVVIMALMAVMLYGSSRYFRKKTGGVTGDIFGFHGEAAEAVFLVLLLAMTNMLSLEE